MSDFQNNETEKRFEYTVDGADVTADYRLKDNTLYIDYVEAPPRLRGTGATDRMMSEIVSFAEHQNLEIVPVCGYAAHWMRKNAQ